jgi:hypothetical protein
VVVAALAFIAAFACSLKGGERGLRWVFVAAMALAVMRGGVQDVLEELPVGNELVAVNAFGPALVAGAALAALIQRRIEVDRLPLPLVYAWCALALACVLDLLTQDVGLKLYGVGLAQYLTYPTLAVLLWVFLRDDEEERLSFLLIALGVFVSLTLFIQAAGITEFVQAAPAYVAGLDANRWAGITGSYLHTSAVLGPISVLALGLALRGRRNWLLASFAILAILLSAQILTYSRSGVVITAVGGLLLLAFCTNSQRLRLLVVGIPATVVAILAGTLGGVDPSESAGRVGGGIGIGSEGVGSPAADVGNEQRFDTMRAALERYEDATLPKQLLGEGIGATGNARKLVSDDPLPVESYYLKVLLETGIVGFLLVAPFLIWATVAFALLAWRAREVHDRAVGAAGFALSLHLIIYPTLEVQVLAMVWWVLLLLCLRARERLSGQGRPSGLMRAAP